MCLLLTIIFFYFYLSYFVALVQTTNLPSTKQQQINSLQNANETFTKSQYDKIFRRVPQESILGPVLFLIYINDIHLRSLEIIAKYTDDMCFVLTVRDSENLDEKLVKCLSAMERCVLYTIICMICIIAIPCISI